MYKLRSLFIISLIIVIAVLAQSRIIIEPPRRQDYSAKRAYFFLFLASWRFNIFSSRLLI